MRSIIHDQALHMFIEGPIQSTAATSNSQQGNDVNKADLSQGYEEQADAKDYDVDIPFYEVNERYD